MPAPSHLDHFDLDIGLRDASCDKNLPPVRRAIAALCIGVAAAASRRQRLSRLTLPACFPLPRCRRAEGPARPARACRR